jgi:pimeloyl-ACP methyl ester carboxylesterase
MSNGLITKPKHWHGLRNAGTNIENGIRETESETPRSKIEVMLVSGQKHHEASPVITEGSVLSKDGTRIGFQRLGSGPSLVFVHGSVATHTDWMRVAKLLSTRFTCYVMDRRGRGHSGIGVSEYSIEREYEDIEAVFAAAGPGTSLIAHSYGAVGALGVTLRNPVSRLVVYEPPFPVEGPIAGENLEHYARAVAKGELDLAVQIGLAAFLRLPPEEISALHSSRAWPRLRNLALSWVRELESMDRFDTSFLENYRSISCPVMMLMGELSPEHPLQDSSRALATYLPGARIVRMKGQDHMAARTAPALIAHLIIEFFSL